MKLFNFSLFAAALVLLPLPHLHAQLLKPIDPNQKAEAADKFVKPGDVQLDTITRPSVDLPNAELSKGTLKMQNTETKSVTDLNTLEHSTVETHVLPQANFTAKHIATQSSDVNEKKLNDAKKKAPVTDRQIRPFTPTGEEEMKKQLKDPH